MIDLVSGEMQRGVLQDDNSANTVKASVANPCDAGADLDVAIRHGDVAHRRAPKGCAGGQ